ncbi:hypothetical protein QYM36_006919 [Artemia franciscana]|uniref:Uncharacterized protein n=1 Tax=Artemia franciscana TaxID=6661 RepID=A0AA88I1U6_ARTSF|nr:hypothetical protein QYM36_006919 [Artemia franciscana]
MPEPKNKEELQTPSRMLIFLSSYSPELSSKNKPLKDLLKKDSFILQNNHRECIKDMKSIMSGLAFFDHSCRAIKIN